MRRSIALLLALAALSVSTAASAQEKTAADYKKSGNEKMDAADFVGALEDYKAAQKLAPEDPALYYNIGRANGLLGHNVEALAALEEFGRRGTPDMKAKVQFEQLIAQTRAKVAYLTVTCDKAGARVLIGGKVIGPAPLTHAAVDAAGEATTISIEAESYREDFRTLPLPGGKETAIECRLLPKDASATLAVMSDTPGTRISVDGKSQGNAPAMVPVMPGSHTVLASREGYEDSQIQVVVRAGEDRRDVTVNLAKSAPLTSKWWFWTGIGVVVVGGVIITAAALTEKSPDNGTIPPGRLSAPLTRF
jgi:hypothetical protein